MKIKTIIIVVIVVAVISAAIYFFVIKKKPEAVTTSQIPTNEKYQRLVDELSKTDGPSAVQKLALMSDEEVAAVYNYLFYHIKTGLPVGPSLRSEIEAISIKYNIFT
jgi:flagellar basal body-associated protein FliL